MTAIQLAVRDDNIEIMEILIGNGADVNIAVTIGNLHHCILPPTARRLKSRITDKKRGRCEPNEQGWRNRFTFCGKAR